MLKSLRLGAALITVLATPISTAFLASPASASTNWVEVSTSEKNSIFYVDAASIQGNGRFRYFWQNITLGSPATSFTERPAYNVVSYKSVDCETFNYRTRISNWYDQNGEMLKSFNYGEQGELRQANSETSSEKALEFVCSSAEPVATPVVATNTTVSSVARTFIEDYKTVIGTQEPQIKNVLLAAAQKNPDSIVTAATNYCKGLRAGLSPDELIRIQAKILVDYSPQVQEFATVSIGAIDALAPEHYCPEFASR